MDSGTAKVRRRFTVAPRQFAIALRVTKTQAADFDTFFVTTIKGGALSFTWTHPRTGAAATCRITDTPQIDPDNQYFMVTFQMEILP
jgi:phage-related protein